MKRNPYLKTALFGAPAIILLVLFVLGPIIMTFLFSFTDMALTGSAAKDMELVGFDNFVHMLRDPSFKTSVINTIIILLFSSIIGQQIVALLFAFFINKKARPNRS